MDISLDLTNLFVFWGISFLVGFVISLLTLILLIHKRSKKYYFIALGISILIGIICLLVAMYTDLSRIWNMVVPENLRFEDGFTYLQK